MLTIDAEAYRSPWRTVHPAVKGVLFGGLLVCALALPAWPGAALVGAVALAFGLGPARVPPRKLVRTAVGPLAFIATGAVTLLVSVGGPDGPIAWDPQGAARAAELTGRASAAVVCQLLFAFTTPLADLLPRLSRVGLPPALVEVVALIYRMLFVALDTARRVGAAQAGRLGYTNGRNRVRSLGALGAALFVRSYDRAARLQRGLECRGYTGALTVLVDDIPLRAPALAAAAVPAVLVTAAALTLGGWT